MKPRYPDIRTLTEPPVIGQRYRVPCVRSLADYGRKRWLPVIGSVHQDAELGIKFDHLHYDPRFMSDACIVWLAGGNPYLPRGKAAAGNAWKALIYIRTIPRAEAPVALTVRVLTCYREMPRFPARKPRTGPLTWESAPVARVLEPLYQDVRLPVGCRVCPHRGMPLDSLPVEPDGTVICSGHGLKLCLKTGRMVARIGDPAEPLVGMPEVAR